MTHIAVVAPVYNEEQNVEEFTNRVSNELKQLTEEFKIILIDDGSKDSSWQKIAEICSKNRRVKGIKLSKNFGHHYAITAGLNIVDADWAVVMDTDLQDRPEVIKDLYQKANTGYDIVFVNRSTKSGQVVSGGFGGGKTQLGVQTDKRVKRIGCFTFKSLVEEKKLLITDADTISEISTFIQVKDSYAADDGYHDDLVMPLVLFSWLTTNPYFKELNNVNLREAMYQERIKQIEEDVVPFGFMLNGTEEEYDVDSGDVWRKEDAFDDRPQLPPGYLTSNL